MPSFLKRIPPAAQIGQHNSNSQIVFELDEPSFLLKHKFNNYLETRNPHVRNYNRSSMLQCPRCGNTEFSLKASFCKICGSQVLNNY